jgi:hypothetical protein
MVELTDSTVVMSQLKTNNTIQWQCVQHKATEHPTNTSRTRVLTCLKYIFSLVSNLIWFNSVRTVRVMTSPPSTVSWHLPEETETKHKKSQSGQLVY